MPCLLGLYPEHQHLPADCCVDLKKAMQVATFIESWLGIAVTVIFSLVMAGNHPCTCRVNEANSVTGVAAYGPTTADMGVSATFIGVFGVLSIIMMIWAPDRGVFACGVPPKHSYTNNGSGCVIGVECNRAMQCFKLHSSTAGYTDHTCLDCANCGCRDLDDVQPVACVRNHVTMFLVTFWRLTNFAFAIVLVVLYVANRDDCTKKCTP
jgi:hypothetical protein